jgi:hypothetical protein
MQGSTSRDHYETLQVSRSADPLIITKTFRILIGLYHPDNKESGDAAMFQRIVEAHETLCDPLRRSAYDRATFGRAPEPNGGRASELAYVQDEYAHDERQLRRMILDTLYTVRRSRPSHPGVALATLVELCGCSIDTAQFSLWYLKGKKLIETTMDDEITITVGGVDCVEAVPSPPERGTPLPALPASNGQLLASNGAARPDVRPTPEASP